MPVLCDKKTIISPAWTPKMSWWIDCTTKSLSLASVYHAQCPDHNIASMWLDFVRMRHNCKRVAHCTWFLRRPKHLLVMHNRPCQLVQVQRSFPDSNETLAADPNRRQQLFRSVHTCCQSSHLLEKTNKSFNKKPQTLKFTGTHLVLCRWESLPEMKQISR